MSEFKQIDVKNLKENIFRLLDDDWTLITAGDQKDFNTMTASWGGMGILWNLPITICFIRPQRYTQTFIRESSYYTLSFFSDEYRKILDFCGSCSGREHDKIKETGLLPFITGNGSIGYEQARLIFECRKVYSDRFREENFINSEIIKKHYPKKDFHHFYIGQITGCYIR